MAGHLRTGGIAVAVLPVITAVGIGVGIGIGNQTIHAANLAQGRPYTISPSAEPNYPDTRHSELTDGRKGSASYLSPEWSGYHVSKGQAVDIVVDLGRAETVYSVTIGMLHHPAVGIMPPIYIAAGLSEDGKRWAVWDVIYPPAPAPGERTTPRRVTYTLPGSAPRPVMARYVRVHLPLEISLFIDEIEVNGVPSGQSGANTAARTSASTSTGSSTSSSTGSTSTGSSTGSTSTGSTSTGTTEPPPVPDSPARAGLPPWPKGDQFDLTPIGPYRTVEEGTGNVHHIVLLPLYPPVRWDMKQLLPYITFGKPVDEHGPAVNEEPLWEPQDWLFDTVLFAPVAAAPSGRFFHTFSNPGSVFADWLWLVDTCFAPDGPLASLEEATAWAGNRLGDAEHKAKVILALPSPNPKQTEFWSGIDEDPGARQYFQSKGLVISRDGSKSRFSGTLQERRAVLEWMIDEILARWQQAGFHRLELAGFYWFEEGVSEKADDQALVKQVAQMVHERGYRFYWIPHFRASGYADWRAWGFDAAMLQPNYYFMPRDEVPPPGSPPESRLVRLRQTAMLARRYEMGIEIELDANVIKDAELRQRLYEYFEAGDRYGYMREAVLAYYQNVNDLAQMARLPGGPGRKVYEDLYRFVQGRFESWKPAGRVVDEAGEPVTGARVQLGEVATATGEGGYFELPALPVDEGVMAVSTPEGRFAWLPLARGADPAPATIAVRRLPRKVLLDPGEGDQDGHGGEGGQGDRGGQLPPGLLILGGRAEITAGRASPGAGAEERQNRELKLVLGDSPLPFGAVIFNLPEGLRDWSNWSALAIDLRLVDAGPQVTALTVSLLDEEGKTYIRTLPLLRTGSGKQTLLVPLVEAATGRFASNLAGEDESNGINLTSLVRVTITVPAVEGKEEVMYVGQWYLVSELASNEQKGQKTGPG